MKESKMDRLRAAKNRTQQTETEARAAYHQALADATGPGGAYDPRTDSAQRAETLRVLFVAARDAATKARLALSGAELRTQLERQGRTNDG